MASSIGRLAVDDYYLLAVLLQIWNVFDLTFLVNKSSHTNLMSLGQQLDHGVHPARPGVDANAGDVGADEEDVFGGWVLDIRYWIFLLVFKEV